MKKIKFFFKKKLLKNLVIPDFYHNFALAIGRLAQLVCLTSRGSAVRIRNRPPIKFSLQIASAIIRAISSAGLERLPYKQRVCGSNP